MTMISALKRFKKLGTKNQDWPQICVILIISLGGFSSAAFFSWTSPSIPRLMSPSSYIGPITLEQSSYFSIISASSTAVMAVVISCLMNKVGRKAIIMFMPIPHVTSWILIIIAKNLTTLYISKAIHAISDAILFCIFSQYMGEIASPNVRGSWGNVMVISAFMGQFVINVVGGYLDIITTAWIFLIFPVTHFVLMFFVPESPYYLLMKSREVEAEECLKMLRWNENVEEELKQLSADVARQMSETGSFSDLFTTRTHRRAFFIAFSMRLFQQFSGLPAFVVYTQYIFSLAGGELTATDCTIIFTGISLIANVLAAFVVHKFSRRTLMITSCLSCAVTLFIETAYFFIFFETDLNISNFTWVPLAGMLMYTVASSIGLGLIPMLMMAELFSASVKNKAVGIITILFSILIIIVPKLYQSLSSTYSPYVPFLLFAISTLIGSVFSYFFVPETKGKTLEEIQKMLSNEKTLRH